MKLNEKQVAVLKAALVELDHAWRRGTANAGFQKRTMELLRGPSGPAPHESEAESLLRLLDRPGAEVHLQASPEPRADDTGEHQEMVADCEARESKLNDWERQFVDSVGRQLREGKTLTPKQAERLEEVWDRVT